MHIISNKLPNMMNRILSQAWEFDGALVGVSDYEILRHHSYITIVRTITIII